MGQNFVYNRKLKTELAFCCIIMNNSNSCDFVKILKSMNNEVKNELGERKNIEVVAIKT